MKIKEIIVEAIKKLELDAEVLVERPGDMERGDFSCNIVMVLARKTGENPRELAEKLVEKLKKDKELALVVDLEKIEVAGPGFINFWVRDEYLSLAMGLAKNDEYWGQSEFMKGKKVLVEYSSPNVAKRFSVGHLRSTIVGQAIYNLYKASGAKMTNDNHLGDWGTQFGMIVAGVEEEKLDLESLTIESLEELYVRFNKRIEDNLELRNIAKEAFARLEKGDENARAIWKKTIEVSMAEFEKIYEKLGVKFENTYGESAYEKMMPEIIEEAKKKGIAVEGEGGAWIVKFEENGKEYMSPAMLVKGDGTTTYFTRDLATIKLRLTEEKLNVDLYVYEVGGEQRLHLRQVFEVVRKLWPTETEGKRFVHVPHGLLTLPEGKMSTRKGNTIKLEELLDKAQDEALDRSEGKYTKKEAELMGINAVKYNELRRSPGMDYVFLWEEALSMAGNSAPYINYAYVRAKKIGEKIETEKTQKLKILFEGEEKNLARWLMKFAEGEVVEEAAKNFSPQLICAYLFEVAKRFNAFYDQNKVLDDPREKERLVLVSAVAEIIKRGMKLLGIEMVEKM